MIGQHGFIADIQKQQGAIQTLFPIPKQFDFGNSCIVHLIRRRLVQSALQKAIV
jgi:hypothetical protein